ncbi:MAG: 2-hydroxy-3-oxopropionate reductase [Pseudomonadota bacterium]|jgi:3-hydroxyisobutyrate dehydrogenase-like beta-hydroxyacid dehydrogenase
MNRTRIGLFGVGLMGHGIATNLVKHGHDLRVFEHAGNQPIQDLLQAGARSTSDAAELARHADVLILCVTGSPQVEAVMLGQTGVLQHLRPGSLVVDCSTSIPASTEKIARQVTASGCRFIDSPMTRLPKDAAAGRLNLLVGAELIDYERALPVLRCFAENITHVGPVGAGHRMKLLHNYVSLGSAVLIAEAAACARQGGIDPQVLVDVLAKGGGGGAALDRMRPHLVQGDPTGLQFTLANALKDLSYYNTMAEQTGADRHIAQAVATTLRLATEQGDPQSYVPELVERLIARRP